jgi:hypothetical protein
MLSPGVKATVLSREEAMAVLVELADVEERLERLRESLRDVLAELES